MKKFTCLLLSIILVMAMAFSFTGCAENADVSEPDLNIPEYETIYNAFEEYRIGYSDYCTKHSYEVYASKDGYTPDEIPCSVVYIETMGGFYKIATLEASREINGNEIVCVDEYYQLPDNILFIARMYFEGDSVSPVALKYVVINDTLYSLNDDTQELVPESRPDSFDFYLTFDEITSLYGV